jgi:hypothetical protein
MDKKRTGKKFQEHYCKFCHKVKDDVSYGPDSYSSEICGDSKPIWARQDCRNKRREEI